MNHFMRNYELMNLRKFSAHMPVLCLHCGYQGPAGVVRMPETSPAGCATMAVTGLLAIPIGLLLGFLGIVVAIVLWFVLEGIAEDMVTPYVLECPRCLAQLNVDKKAYNHG